MNLNFCSHCRALVLSFRPQSYFECLYMGKIIYLHRVCLEGWLEKR